MDVEVRMSMEPMKRCRHALFVVGGTGHDLFGRSWLEEFVLDWPRLMRTVSVV